MVYWHGKTPKTWFSWDWVFKYKSGLPHLAKTKWLAAFLLEWLSDILRVQQGEACWTHIMWSSVRRAGPARPRSSPRSPMALTATPSVLPQPPPHAITTHNPKEPSRRWKAKHFRILTPQLKKLQCRFDRGLDTHRLLKETVFLSLVVIWSVIVSFHTILFFF